LNDGRKRFKRACCSINIGGTKLGVEKVVTTKDIQREITVVIVVAMKKAVLLITMKGRVGGIQVEDDFCGRLWVTLQKELSAEAMKRIKREVDLVIAVIATLSCSRDLQAIKSRLSSQRVFRLLLSGKKSEELIVAQLLVIIEIFIPKTKTIKSLANKREELMVNARGVSPVGETAGVALRERMI
jgi:hypothetical protein